MSFRVLLIENDMNIRVKLNSLVFDKDDGPVNIPISDISTIVIDNLKVSLTTRTLCLLAENNISVIFCNQDHLPIGFYSSYDNHSRISKKIQFQINKSKAFYDELWSEIVVAKIRNQQRVLQILNKDSERIEMLEEYVSTVVSGDTHNREAHAAKVYFNELMGDSFSRGNPDIIYNSGLDYGYTILRSFLSRLCVGYGLNSQIGIHHRSEYNRFNLVDDIIEPLRPFVDLFVYNMMLDAKYFTPSHRHSLVNIVNHEIKYNNKRMFMSSMMEDYISQIAGLLEGKNNSILYPSVADYIQGDIIE